MKHDGASLAALVLFRDRMQESTIYRLRSAGAYPKISRISSAPPPIVVGCASSQTRSVQRPSQTLSARTREDRRSRRAGGALFRRFRARLRVTNVVLKALAVLPVQATAPARACRRRSLSDDNNSPIRPGSADLFQNRLLLFGIGRRIQQLVEVKARVKPGLRLGRPAQRRASAPEPSCLVSGQSAGFAEAGEPGEIGKALGRHPAQPVRATVDNVVD